MDNKKYSHRWIRHTLSSPFIYIMIIPLVIFDIFLEIYHRICFPLYAIPYVKRQQYIRVDRHKLQYLNWQEKINCAYCGYANGLIHYASEILARTEKYWCGIKHEKDPMFLPPKHHDDFLEYGDEKSFKNINKK